MNVGDRVMYSDKWLRQVSGPIATAKAKAKRGTIQAKLTSRRSGSVIVLVKWDDTEWPVKLTPVYLTICDYALVGAGDDATGD